MEIWFPSDFTANQPKIISGLYPQVSKFNLSHFSKPSCQGRGRTFRDQHGEGESGGTSEWRDWMWQVHTGDTGKGRAGKGENVTRGEQRNETYFDIFGGFMIRNAMHQDHRASKVGIGRIGWAEMGFNFDSTMKHGVLVKGGNLMDQMDDQMDDQLDDFIWYYIMILYAYCQVWFICFSLILK